MEVREFLRAKGQTITAFAAQCGCSHATMSRIAAKRQPPSRALAARIVRESESQITLDDLDFSPMSEPVPRFWLTKSEQAA